MRMSWKWAVGTGVAILLMLALAVPVVAQEAEDEEQAEAAPDAEGQMAEYMKLAEPGPHHEHLDRLAGTWDFTAKVWSPAGGEPSESKGTWSAVWIFGGRYLKSQATTTLMGMPFEGMGLDGYDNVEKHYVASWADSMGTGIMSLTGSCEADGRVRTMHAKVKDPMSGQTLDAKSVTTILNDNSYMYESFILLPDGNEFKQVELVAKRRP